MVLGDVFIGALVLFCAGLAALSFGYALYLALRGLQAAKRFPANFRYWKAERPDVRAVVKLKLQAGAAGRAHRSLMSSSRPAGAPETPHGIKP